MNDRQKDLIQKFAALAGLLVLVLVFSMTSSAFFSVGNAMTVALQVTSIVYLGIGATFVILTGGIDLSVGSVLALSGVVAGLLVKAGMPVAPATGPASVRTPGTKRAAKTARPPCRVIAAEARSSRSGVIQT